MRGRRIKIYVVSISFLNGDVRRYSGIGSYAGCLSEAKAVMRTLKTRGQKFTAMGPGDWQSEALLVELYEWPGDRNLPEVIKFQDGLSDFTRAKIRERQP